MLCRALQRVHFVLHRLEVLVETPQLEIRELDNKVIFRHFLKLVKRTLLLVGAWARSGGRLG